MVVNCKGNPLISGKARLVKYYNVARKYTNHVPPLGGWAPRTRKSVVNNHGDRFRPLGRTSYLINGGDPNYRDPAVRLGSFGFKKVKKNLKAVRVVSVPLRFGSSRFKKRFGSMSAIRVLPESNSNLAISFQSILCWNYF